MDTLLLELKRSLESAVRAISPEELVWRPANKWSVAEILEHLYLSYTGTIRGLEKMLETGAPSPTRPTMQHRMRGAVVFGLSYLPSGREAPAATRPKGLPSEKVRVEIWEKLSAMDAILTRCEDRFGRGERLLDHPFLGPLTARQWRKFHLLHGRHHVRQIVQLKKATPVEVRSGELSRIGNPG